MKTQRFKFIVGCFWAAIGAGCSSDSVTFRESPPEVPKPPVVLVNTVEDARKTVVSEKVEADWRWEQDGNLGKGKTIAILPISGPGLTGDLLTAVTTLKFRDNNVKVIERQVSRAIREEIEMLDFFNMPTEDKIAKIKQLIPADYFLVGAVTTLDTNIINVALPQRKFDSRDYARYSNDYKKWRTQAIAYLNKMDEAAQIFNDDPPFQEEDKRSAWLLRNSIAKVKRDIEATDFVGYAREEKRSWQPLLVRPDFFNRNQKTKKQDTPKPEKFDYSIVSVYGPYSMGGYRPLLVHLAENLPKSPRRLQFEWDNGRKVIFQVPQTNASVAFRLIDASTSAYLALGVLEVNDNTGPAAIKRLGEHLAKTLAAKFK